jgi:UDP-glucuronate decarboxylase
MKRVLITGGAGFIGSHLCERLLARGDEVLCPASPVHYQFDPVQTTRTSVHGAINILGLVKRAPSATWTTLSPG